MFTTLTAYGFFFVAEHLHCSGVLAALAAGLIVGNHRDRGEISESGRHSVETFWEYAAFIVNSLIFILIGLQEAAQEFRGMWLPVLVAICLVTLGIAVAIYPLCAWFAKSRFRVGMAKRHILLWSSSSPDSQSTAPSGNSTYSRLASNRPVAQMTPTNPIR